MENTFNDNLRRIRKEKKITQEQLAEFVGVSPQAVSKWEMNSFPDASLLPKIAEKLEVSIDELFGLKSENILFAADFHDLFHCYRQSGQGCIPFTHPTDFVFPAAAIDSAIVYGH